MLTTASRFYDLGLILLASGAIAACTVNDYRGNCNPPGATQGGSRSTAGGSGGNGGKTSASGGKASDNGGESAMAPSGGDSTDAAGASAGGAGATAFACVPKRPSARGITDFGNLEPDPMRDGQFVFTTILPGSTFAYPDASLTLSDAAMALNASGSINAASGFGVYFADCIDAAAVSGGVSFNIRGLVGDSGTLSFRVLTPATTAVDVANRRGSCDAMGLVDDAARANCLGASVEIPVTADGADVTVLWSELAGGIPIDQVDGSEIIGFEWAFAFDGETTYDVDVTLDNLGFVAKAP